MEQELIKLIGVEVLKLSLKLLRDFRAKGGDLDRLLEAAAAENDRDIYEILGIPRPQR